MDLLNFRFHFLNLLNLRKNIIFNLTTFVLWFAMGTPTVVTLLFGELLAVIIYLTVFVLVVEAAGKVRL